MLGKFEIARRLTALIVVVVASLVLLPGAASASVGDAQTTYVAGVGGVDYASASDSNSCSAESAPCLTLAGALAVTESGGTVELSGTVTESSPASADQDVTIEANPDGTSAELTGGASDDAGLLDVSANTVKISGITFAGNGNDGGPNSEITAATAGDLTIIDSAFAKGITDTSGGAIYFSGSGELSVTDSSFNNNITIGGGSGGAIFDDGSGTFSVTDSTFSQNSAEGDGGAIDNGRGTLDVTGSTFTGNSGDVGGAISNDDNGTLDVSDSSFSANDASGSDGYGGAISNGDMGGSGVATVTWSTFYHNAAATDGGAIDNGDNGHTGTLTVTDSTFSSNSDSSEDTLANGVTGTGTIYVAGDLFDGSCNAATGTWHDYGDNAATSSGCIGGSTSGMNGDVVDTTVGSDLGSFGSNGGPTQTILPQPGDPAIDLLAGNSSFTVPAGRGSTVTVGCPVAADQRGFPNAGTNGCDAGSVQTGGAATVYVAGSGGVDVGNASDSNNCADETSPCATLAGALAQTAPSGTIELSGTLTESSATSVDQDVTIEANPDGTSAEIEGAVAPAINPDTTGLLSIGYDTVAIQGLTLSDGTNTSGGGGAIDNNDHGTLTISDSTLTGNAGGDGGAIDNNDEFSENASVTITDSTLSDNTASYDGGAIDNTDDGLSESGSVTIADSTLTGNAAGVDGGAIDNNDDGGYEGGITITDSTLSGNTASGDGDAIDNNDHGGSGGHVYVAADVLSGTCDGSGWTDDGYNAATDASCLGGTAASSDATVGSDADDLGALADNGGPTETAELLAGNPAIDVIPSATSFTVPAGSGTVTVACPVAADQRGIASVSGGACDAGAVQYAGQSLSFGGTLPASAVVGQSGSMLAPSSSSGLTVALSLDPSTTNDACSLSGDAVSFDHAGSCVLDLNQAGNANFGAAAQAQQTIAVGPALTSTAMTAGSSSLTATVSVVAPGGGTPSGTVLFSAGGQALGSATLVDGVATLSYSVPPNTTQTITAEYQGSDDYASSSSSASASGPTIVTPTVTPATVVDPTITATLHSSKRKSPGGWWRTPVKVSFHCAAGSAGISGGCPSAVVLKRSGAHQAITRRITAKDGGTATVTVSGIKIDLTRPKVKISGPQSGASYLITSAAARCVASERISGIRSCRLTRRVRQTASGEAITYTAKATSNAGTTATTTETISVNTIGLLETRELDGVYQVRPGRAYTLEVLSNVKPRYIDAAVSPLPPSGTHAYFVRAGEVDGVTLWKLRVAMEDSLSLYRQWTIGVLTGHVTHTLKLRT